MYKLYLSPLQFDDGEGTGEAQGTETQGTVGEAQEASEEKESPEGEPKKKADLKALLKEDAELKAQYDKAIQSQITRRFKDVDALREKSVALDNLTNLVRSAFPDAPQDGDPNNLLTYLQGKSDLFAEAASQAGMTVEAYRRMQEMEAKNRALLGEQRAMQEEARRQELYAKWDSEIPEVKAIYPDFDEQEEMTNEETGERFTTLLSQGWTMRQAYEAIHMHEIMDKTAQAVKKQTAMDTAKQIKTGQGDVKESATGKTALSPVGSDLGKMSTKEIEDIVRRVSGGERVVL